MTRIIVVVVVVLLASVSLGRAGVLVSDGDFASWSSFSFNTQDPTVATPGPGTSTGSATRVATGGDPGAYLSLTHTVTTGDVNWTGGIDTAYTYDPSVQGAIASLDVSVDLRDLVEGGSTAWQLVVLQSGVRYYSVPLNAYVDNSTWQSFSEGNLTSGSFDTDPFSGFFGILPDGNTPNFGANGPPMEFGFMIGNRIVGIGTITNTIDMDNFAVSVPVSVSVSEPSSAAILFSAGLILLGWQSRKPGKVLSMNSRLPHSLHPASLNLHAKAEDSHQY